MHTDILYGVNPAFEAVLAGRRTVHGIMIDQAARNRPRLQRLAELAAERGIPIRWEEKGRLIDLARTRENQGVVLEVDPYPYVPTLELLASANRLLLLDNIEDPHNVGAIMRTAEVFGFGPVLLPVRGVPPVLPSVVKASAGATEHLRIAKDMAANQIVRHAVEAGFSVAALDGKGDRTFADVLALKPERLLLVCGGEDAGISRYILNTADHVVRIPQRGRIGSLNASVAAAIAIHALAG